jgi:hypothetical protein
MADASMAEVVAWVVAEKDVPVVYFCGPMGGRSGRRSRLLSEVRFDAHGDSARRTIGRGHVLGEADMSFFRSPNRHDARIGLGKGEYFLRQGLGIGFAEDHATSFRSVFNTAICRKRAGTAPCETGAVCSG